MFKRIDFVGLTSNIEVHCTGFDNVIYFLNKEEQLWVLSSELLQLLVFAQIPFLTIRKHRFSYFFLWKIQKHWWKTVY